MPLDDDAVSHRDAASNDTSSRYGYVVSCKFVSIHPSRSADSSRGWNSEKEGVSED